MARIKHSVFSGLCIFILVVLWPRGASWAGVYTIGSQGQWSTWTLPNGTPLGEAQQGVVQVTDDGRIGLVRIRKHINAVSNADQFTHRSAEHPNQPVRGGIKGAGSNRARAAYLIDGDPNTWWGPDESDDLKHWWVQIDLGRAVSATSIRLIFADSTGTQARPFEQFTVYVSDGARTYVALDMFSFNVAGRTTKPNTDRVVEYPLGPGSMGVQSGYGLIYTADAQMVQYVWIICDAKSPRPGLAEVEVWALGDNLALGTIERGGYWTPGAGSASANLYDGDIMSFWTMMLLTEKTWESGGAYFAWDLGALFWIDTIQVLATSQDFVTRIGSGTCYYIEGYILRVSDGSRTPDGRIDYETIADIENKTEPYQNTFKHTFEPRLVRHLFMRHAHGTSSKYSPPARILEVQLYGDGYPAGVTLESDLVDLGNIAGDQKGKNLTHLSWDADAPPNTWIEVRSMSGDSLIQEIRYYDTSGKEISESAWTRKPPSYRGEKKILLRPGDDWSPWSDVYRYSGESFLSPSPRRYVKLQVKLLSADPDAAPSLNTLSLYFTDPFIRSVFGEIVPKAVPADRDTVFTYRLMPTRASGDVGFDRVLILVPSVVEEASVALRVDDESVSLRSVEVVGDSLVVDLPGRMHEQRVEVDFVTRVFRNTTLFDAFVGSTTQPDVWQRVDAKRRGATTVSVPLLAGSADLIGNLVIEPRGITPNGDGIGDRAVVRFSVFKVDEGPEVTIYSLTGERVRELICEAGVGRTYVAEWDGRDDSGVLVSPGVYVCRIGVDADAGRGVVHRMLGVVF